MPNIGFLVSYSNLPYRTCVGIVLFNASGNILVGSRIDSKVDIWQMPQGGVDKGESLEEALFREMKEEIGTNKAELIADHGKWLFYDLPYYLLGKLWNGKFKGQKQRWFLLKFNGVDSDININTDIPEFKEWRWSPIDEIVDHSIYFKRDIYREIVDSFGDLIRAECKNDV